MTNSETHFIEPRTMQNRFKTALKKNEIESANFHALRHTFATRCVELGFDVKSLSEILGHATVNITMNRYVHPTLEMKKNNILISLIKTTIYFCSLTDIVCIAEGIENDNQLNFLVSFGVRYFQGYLISKPIEDIMLGSFVISCKNS